MNRDEISDRLIAGFFALVMLTIVGFMAWSFLVWTLANPDEFVWSILVLLVAFIASFGAGSVVIWLIERCEP